MDLVFCSTKKDSLGYISLIRLRAYGLERCWYSARVFTNIAWHLILCLCPNQVLQALSALDVLLCANVCALVLLGGVPVDCLLHPSAA